MKHTQTTSAGDVPGAVVVEDVHVDDDDEKIRTKPHHILGGVVSTETPQFYYNIGFYLEYQALESNKLQFSLKGE